MKQQISLLASLTFIAVNSCAMMQNISDEAALARCEDTVQNFFAQKNLFAALCLQASQAGDKAELLAQLRERIKNKTIDTSDNYVFMTAADAHKRLFPCISITKDGDKETNDKGRYHTYKALIRGEIIDLVINETKNLPQGYEHKKVNCHTDSSAAALQASKATFQENDVKVDLNAYYLPEPSAPSDQPVPFISPLLAQRYSNASPSYEIYSSNFSHKCPDHEKIMQEFQALLDI